MMLALVCTLAVQVWHEGKQNTLRLDNVQCVEFADKESNEGLLVNCSKDSQFDGYMVLTEMPMRVNPNDCLYTSNPEAYSAQFRRK